MPSMKEPITDILLYEDVQMYGDETAELLAARGYRTSRLGTAPDADSAFLGERPGLLVVFDHDGTAGADRGAASYVRAKAQRLGIPVLVVMEGPSEPEAMARLLTDADDWVSVGGLATELPARVARLLRRRPPPSADGTEETHRNGAFPIGPHFLSLVVHDLHTPLNVIGLSIRMVKHSMPDGDPEVREDLRFLEENFNLIVRMLAQLGDFQRVHSQNSSPDPVEFSPRRLVEELVEGQPSRPGSKDGHVTVEIHDSCPHAVSLDPLRARLALKYVLSNALTASEGNPVRVVLRGGDGRWVTEVVVDLPPPDTVKPVPITPFEFERLCGSARERRGMDLAIAAKVSEVFGGSVRLETVEGQHTAVVLDWPARA